MERSLPTPDSSPQPSEGGGEKSKAKKRNLRAPIPDAKITEAKESSRADSAAPKVPLHELFAQDAPAPPKEEKPKKSKKSKKEKAQKEPEQPAETAKATDSQDTKDAKPETEATPEPSEALDLPAAEITDAEEETAEAAPETTNEGVIIDRRGEAPAGAETDPDHAEDSTDNEPAPSVAPPIMFDIPLRREELVEPAPVAEQAPVIPPLESLADAEANMPKRIEVAPLNIIELEHQSEQPEQPEIPRYSAYVPETKTAAEKRAAEREKADAEYYAEKRGLSRGVTSGAFVGYLFGRRRGRINAERAAKQEIKKRDDQIEGLEAGQRAAETRTTLFAGTIERLQGQVRSLEQRARTVVARSEEEPAARTPEALKPSYEATRPVAQERLKTLEKAKAVTEIKPEDSEITEQTYVAPEGKRFESSSWHRYEVDKHTGKLVEDPNLVYGKEFKHEQKQERMQSKIADQAAAQQFGHAVVVGASVDEPVTKVVDPISAHTQANLQPDLNPYRPPRQKVEPKEMVQEVGNYIKQPIIWVAALIIVVLLFSFGILH